MESNNISSDLAGRTFKKWSFLVVGHIKVLQSIFVSFEKDFFSLKSHYYARKKTNV